MSKTNYIFFFLFFTVITSCTKSDCWRFYTFESPVTVNPSSDSVNLEDTIWLELNIDNFLEDKATGEVMDLSNIELGFKFGIYRFDTTEFLVATNSFSPFAVKGEIAYYWTF